MKHFPVFELMFLPAIPIMFGRYILSEDLGQVEFKKRFIDTCDTMKRCESINGIPSLMKLIKLITPTFEKGAFNGLEPLIHAALLNHYIHPDTETFTKKFY